MRRRRYQRQNGTLCGICCLLTIWRIYVEFCLDRRTSPHLPLPQACYFQPQQFSNSYPPNFQNRPFPAGYTNSSCPFSFQSIMSTSCCQTSLQLLSTFAQPSSFSRPFGFPFSKQFFLTKLHERLLQVGIPTLGFSGHSIRKGAAVTAAMNGIS